MARKASNKIDENTLTKGQLRKLNALRKSLGIEIADKAFSEWLKTQPTAATGQQDAAAERIAEALYQLVETEGLRIPRGGYIVRRGRGRVVVEPAAEPDGAA